MRKRLIRATIVFLTWPALAGESGLPALPEDGDVRKVVELLLQGRGRQLADLCNGGPSAARDAVTEAAAELAMRLELQGDPYHAGAVAGAWVQAACMRRGTASAGADPHREGRDVDKVIAAVRQGPGKDLASLCVGRDSAVRAAVTEAVMSLAKAGKLDGDPYQAGGEAGAWFQRACADPALIAAARPQAAPTAASQTVTAELPVIALAEVPMPAVPPARGAGRGPGLDAPQRPSPTAGTTDEFGLVVTPEIAEAYAAAGSGDAESMLTAAQAAEASADSDARRWRAGSLRWEALARLDRAAEAEEVAEALAVLEKRLVGHGAHARSLRGLARIQYGDSKAGTADLAAVAVAIGSWHLPSRWSAPPSKLLPLRLLVAAQLRAYTGLALSGLLEGDAARALAWADAAESLYADQFAVEEQYLGGVGRDGTEGRAYNLAVLAAARDAARGRYGSGRDERATALGFFMAREHAYGIAVVHGLEAHAALLAGNAPAAAEAARRGERVAAQAGLGQLVWRFAAARGEALERQGRIAEAESAFRTAQAGLNLASGALASDDSKLRVGVGKEGVTLRLIDMDIASGNLTAAYRDAEQGRARAFVDMLRRVKVAPERQAGAVAAIRRLEVDILRLRLAAASGSAGDARQQQRLLDQRAVLLAALRREDADLADTLAIGETELASVREHLGPDEVLVYGLPGEQLRILLASRGETRLLDPGLSQAELTKLVRAMAAAATSGDSRRQRQLAQQLATALRIAEWKGAKGVWVVPAGAMHFVPWGALPLAAPVVVLPTGGWLERPSAISVAESAVVVGDPDFSGRLEQLPGAREEAAEVARRLGVKPLLGEAATEAGLREAVGRRSGILHLATHGLFDPLRPLRSAIVLAGPSMLTAERLFEAPLPASLVVLSACDTGVGRAVAGDDYLGLVRSLYLGGARAVVSSLWPVDDEGTRLFMVTFHEAARRGDLGSAWAAARDHLIAGGWPPSAYGAFVLGGSRR
jgi:hypothetical protein